jgi:hypothetical protein
MDRSDIFSNMRINVMDDTNHFKKVSGALLLKAEFTVHRRFWRRNRAAILEAARGVLTGIAREVTGQPDGNFEITVLGAKSLNGKQRKLETRLKRRLR